jgi:hypothetical protein
MSNTNFIKNSYDAGSTLPSPLLKGMLNILVLMTGKKAGKLQEVRRFVNLCIKASQKRISTQSLVKSFKRSLESTKTSKAVFIELCISFNSPYISLLHTVTLLSNCNQVFFCFLHLASEKGVSLLAILPIC